MQFGTLKFIFMEQVAPPFVLQNATHQACHSSFLPVSIAINKGRVRPLCSTQAFVPY